MKKFVSLFLSFVMLLSITAGLDFSAYAATGSEIVSYARQFIGYPYVYGTQGPNSFDCSGFVQYVFKHFGIYLPASSTSYWNNPSNYGTVVGTGSTANAKAGDVISWSGHVAIYTENGYCVEALNSKYGVCEKFKVDAHTNGTNYRVIRINGVTSGSSGGSSDNKNLPEKPSIPKVTILSNSQRQIKFEWNSSANTTCYNLFVFSENDTNNPIQSHWAIRKNELITTLPNGKYLVKLCSENETPNQNYYTDGDFSSVFEINDLIPDKPYLSIINITNSSRQVVFKWNNICNATCYNLFIYSVNNTATPVQSHWAIRKNELITTLPNGKYVARLCSENETSNQNYYTDGDLSSVFEVNSLIPDKPKDPVIIVDNNDGTVTFRWDKVNNASCYNLFIYSVNDTTTPVQSHWAIRKNELITTLPNGTYVAKLCSENESSNQNYYTDGNITKSFIVNKSLHTHSYNSKVTKSATCSSTGIKTYTCTICGATKTETIPKTNHSYDSGRITTQANCYQNGIKTYICTACGAAKTETIPKTSHSYSWKNSGGYIVNSCNNCGNEKIRLPFEDLYGYEYYGDYIAYTSVYNKFITGTNPPERTLFSPATPITRAMFVTILYRMAGEPYANNNPYRTSPFTDITDTSVYYYDAACWALKNGITTETTFKPFDNVSREQTASFLFRYAKDNGKLGNSAYKNVNLADYPDYYSVHGWAVEAMQWANYNGMITGTQQGYINPQGATQRIHATKILYGFGKTCNIGNFE